MKCYNHPDVDAVGLCKKCLKGICHLCAIEHSNSIVCRDACGSRNGKRKILTVSLLVVALFVATFATQNWLSMKRQDAEATRRIEQATLLARKGAEQLQSVLLAAIARGEVKEEQFFDEQYQSIPESNPPKFHTVYDQFFDHEVQPILDRLMTDKYVVFVVAADRNGYLPTHISKYSQPLTGDFETDKVNNRGKRIFNDPIGLAAAKNTGAPLVQQYKRVTGEWMADCAVPVQLGDKHWGTMRVGVALGKRPGSTKSK